MSTALSLVLSSLVSSYDAVEPNAAPASKSPAKSKAVKSAPISATVKAASPSPHVVKPSNVTTDPLPKAGTISAEEFLKVAAHYNVSWTDSTTPTRHTTPKLGTTIEQLRAAIAGYCGWDPSLDLGTQDRNARTKAQAEIALANGRPAIVARPSLTIAGLVAGMPDHRAKRLADLKGRERLAVDTIVEHTKAASLAKTDQDRQVSEALAQVERERLQQIRKDLAAEFGE